MTITITASGIALDGPLVAGEKVAVSVSGLSLAAEDKPTLALLARFPDALLASVELAEDAQTPGTWTGELDTATKQTALFFATARADERRDAALELVAGRTSLARLTVPMANSALCPKPDGSPFASPVYIPVPGPPGQVGDPYDQAPEMDGEASAGSADEYARGDHRHPTDTSRASTTELSEGLAAKQDTIADLATIRSGAAAGATAVQPAALSAYRTATAQDAIDGAQDTAISAKYSKPATGIPASDLASAVQTALTDARVPTAHASTHATGGSDEITPASIGALTGGDVAMVAFTGSYTDLSNTPAIRYAFASPTPTVSGTSATVACEDRAINNFTVATGITSLTITPPAAVTGRARDFFCRVTLTDSSLPTVTLSGATIDIGATEVAGMTQGVNLLMFTEIASGHWLASRRSAS